MENIPSIDLHVNTITSTPHKVEEYNGQKVFYSQNWQIDFSSSMNDYKSPVFSEKNDQTFTIFFTLSFNDIEKVELSGFLVKQVSFQVFKVFFRIGDPKNKNVIKNDVWSFNWQKNRNITNFPDIKKSDITFENGWLSSDNKLNVYFEISYNNASKVQPKAGQQKYSQEDIEKKLKQTPGRIGLKNMNSMCYINSFLQVLFHIPEFRQIIFSVDTSQSKSKNVLKQTQFLFYMMENSSFPCSAEDLANVIPFCSTKGNSGKQQDAFEFAMNYLDELEKDLKGTTEANTIKNLFFGLYKSIIKCKNVDFEKANSEQFMTVNIPVFQSKSGNEIQQLNNSFQQYISKSELNYKTDQFGLQNAEHWIQFVNLPPILQICFLRSTYDTRTFQLEKKEFPISFQNTLYLYYLTNNYDDEFHLYAVLVHGGGGDCGHYCVFIRDLPGKKWFKYNDSTVSEVTKEDAIRGNFGTDLKKNPEIAYILYYVRKSDEDHLFKNMKNSGISTQMKDFMESLRLKKSQEEYEKNNISFQFILEENLNSKKSIEDFDSTLSDKILKIQKSESRYTLYYKVMELFQRNLKAIRLWFYDKKSSTFEFILPSKKLNLSNLATNFIFIQNKEITEKLFSSINGNGNVMIFLKYFDTRLKLPIRYIGPLLLDENGHLDVPQICSKLCFPEWTQFYFFIEKTPTSVQMISPEKTFKQGNVLIVQINKKETALTKLILDNSTEEVNNINEKIEELRNQLTNEKIDSYLPNLKSNPIFENAELNDFTATTTDAIIDNNTELPQYKAEDYIKDLRTDLLDYFLASKFNVMHFIVYNYEYQNKPKFTVDFPASLTFNDMCNIIKKIENLNAKDSLILLFNKDQRHDKAAYDYITESRFTTQIQYKKFPENRIYYFFADGITSMKNKLIYNLEVAPDGYNVSFRKTIIEKQVSPMDLLNICVGKDQFHDFDIDSADSLRCFTIYESKIDEVIKPNSIIQSNLHPVRICKKLKPEKDEVPVRVYHAKVDKQLGLTFIKEPFYINLKDGITVSEFKKKVMNGTIIIDNKEEFENTKIEVMKIDNHRSSGIFLENPDDQLIGLKEESIVYVIYK